MHGKLLHLKDPMDDLQWHLSLHPTHIFPELNEVQYRPLTDTKCKRWHLFCAL